MILMVQSQIQVVQVDTVDDAIAFLQTLKGAASTARPIVFPLSQMVRLAPAA